MLKLIALIIAMLLLASTGPVREEFSRYKAVEAYEVRPGVLLMPRYSADGQVCEIALERLEYSPEKINLDPDLSREEIDQIVQEVVPPEDRGPTPPDFLKSLISRAGNSITTTTDYENVSVQTVGQVLAESHRHGITEADRVATIRWKHRKCQ